MILGRAGDEFVRDFGGWWFQMRFGADLPPSKAVRQPGKLAAIVMSKPFLHCHHRFKNGKDHCYWSIAEKVRTGRGWVQRHILYLGEINDSQRQPWTRVIEVFDPVRQQTAELALYPDSSSSIWARVSRVSRSGATH